MVLGYRAMPVLSDPSPMHTHARTRAHTHAQTHGHMRARFAFAWIGCVQGVGAPPQAAQRGGDPSRECFSNDDHSSGYW